MEPVPSTVTKKYPQRGPLQQFRFAEATSFSASDAVSSPESVRFIATAEHVAGELQADLPSSNGRRRSSASAKQSKLRLSSAFCDH
jgi:hypothetical protein